jgi:hypothetical protein
MKQNHVTNEHKKENLNPWKIDKFWEKARDYIVTISVMHCRLGVLIENFSPICVFKVHLDHMSID